MNLLKKVFPKPEYIDRTAQVDLQRKRLAAAREIGFSKPTGRPMATKIIPNNSLSARARRIYSEKPRSIQ